MKKTAKTKSVCIDCKYGPEECNRWRSIYGQLGGCFIEKKKLDGKNSSI